MDPSIALPPASSGPLDSYEKIIVVHGILSFLGFLVLMPAGALVARYMRVYSPRWFRLHWILQLAIGVSWDFNRKPEELNLARSFRWPHHSCRFCYRPCWSPFWTWSFWFPSCENIFHKPLRTASDRFWVESRTRSHWTMGRSAGTRSHYTLHQT